MELKCENNTLFVYPLLSEIYKSYHSIIDQIANISQELPTLESWIGIKTVRKAIFVTLPNWYLQEVHERLEKILENLFQPIISYIEKLRDQFNVAYDIKTRQNVIAYVAEGHTFEECIERVEDFNHLVREINGLV